MPVGVAAWRLGAGRSRKEDPVSPVAGIRCLAKRGDRVEAGQPVLELHTDDPARFDAARHGIDAAVGDGAMAIGDALIRATGAPLAFVPDGLMGDDAETVKDALRDSLQGLLERDWDTLLMAHGDPIAGGAQKQLRDFLS